MASLKGKAALVTGAGGGIGRAAALAYARAGAKVVIGNRNEQAGRETVDLIKKAGGEAFFQKTDVSREADIKALVDFTVKTCGGLDIAFNNSGVEGVLGPVVEAKEADIDQVMDVNIKGVLLSMKHEIPAMLKRGGGAIVNNASIAGTIGFASASVYVASKHAVVGMTKTVALETARQNIRVNAVGPGPIDTGMLDRFAHSLGAPDSSALGNMTPMGRVGRPEEIAGAVVWLSSDEASYVTGQTLYIDAGWTAQ
jgi:NAD(P)-dependent dehydrogenase (short-subunit alcohol dehydrogenase family)